MESVFSNGGVIGATLDYNSTEQYIISTTTAPATIEMVGTTGIITATSSTLTLPTGLQEGDLVVLASAADVEPLILPTGFTLGQSGNSNSVNYLWAYKFMGATPDTSITGLATDGERASHLAVAFRGVDRTTPLAVASPSVTTNIDGQPDPPAVESVTAGSLVLALGFLDDDLVAGTVGPPSGYTLAAASQATSPGSTVMAAYQTPSLNGTANPGAFTGGADSWVGATAVLKQGTVTVPLYGNKKNSGIWNLEAVFDASAAAGIAPSSVEYLVIAGGAGGGNPGNDGGGGGAGGYRSSVSGEQSGGGVSAESPLSISAGTAYTVTVGAGGAAGANGSNSVFHTITAIGGGAGGPGGIAGAAQPGGSGGGGGASELVGGAGTAGQGFAGGIYDIDAAGGGGAGGAGANGANPAGGAGGIGITSSITGTAVGRAGGGGGGGDGTPVGAGTSGGGNGGNGNTTGPTGGAVNTGGGGGGAGGTTLSTSAAGGSGVVILRYPATASNPTISAGLTASTTTVGANKVTVFTAGTGTVTF